MELRRVFDTIPEQFDRYRPRYCPALFDDLIARAGIGPAASVLELGPGTGQATGPILDTGCDYHAIELGERLCEMMRRKYGDRPNFHIECGDFITHDFGGRRFDLIYSAATIQWIPEDIAFSRTFDLLRPGGTLAMLLTQSDYKTPNEALYQAIQRVYETWFKPATPYPHRSFSYANATDYGYVDFEKREYPGRRVLTAEEYVAYCGTHCDHIVIPEPDRTRFFEGLRDAVLAAGGTVAFNDTHVLYLTRKPSIEKEQSA